MSQRFDFGSLTLPGTWKTSAQLELVDSGTVVPGSSIIVRRTATDLSSPELALTQIIEELRLAFPALKPEDHRVLRFEDGAVGVSATIRTELGGGRTALQSHWARIDRGTLSHLSLTVDASRAAELAQLAKIASSYRPS